MRTKLLLAAVPALLLGLAACDDQTAQDTNQPGTPSTAERPAAPPAPPTGAAPTATTPGASRPGGSSGNTQ
ncbi:MAG TPA: hypothetical protein VD978_06025 [Azospirillum sp.]|nr:hypothetical protein [Azospirillum sp.]